jgi:hypothetical protein
MTPTPLGLDGPRLLEGVYGAPHLRSAGEVASSRCPDSTGTASATRLSLTPAWLRTAYHSDYAVDRNNGAVWDGRGLSIAWSAGASWSSAHVRLVIQPTFAFQQNSRFDIAPGGPVPFAYPYHRLDWPQRFGERAYWTIDAGQSLAGVRLGPVEASFSTENLWWGPARRYPLLLSNSAAGPPHLRLGLSRPTWIGIGSVRVHALWARLDPSGYFFEPHDRRRLLTGFFAEYQPAFAPSLTLGLAGLQHNLWEDRGDLGLNLFTFVFKEKASTLGNGLLSLTASWSLPESGFEVYGEFGKEDYWHDVEDLLGEPGHAAAYTIGFEKVLATQWAPMRLSAEIGHLAASPTVRTELGIARVTWYEHSRVGAGHTQRGQLLGAWIGPGATAQFLGVDFLLESRQIGAYAELVKHDEDFYLDRLAHVYGFRGHDVEWSVSLQGVEHAGPLALRWEAGVSRRKNRSFIGLDRINWDFRRETNLNLVTTAVWQP